MSADVERNLLNHYKLTGLFPQEWPATADDPEDVEDMNASLPERQMSKRSRRSSRFSNLDPQPISKNRHSLPRDTGGGSGNLVQRDEPDPLGIAPSVVQQLRRKGVPVDEDLRLRNRFMLSSTTFSPALFLSKVHQTASTDDLLHGLDYLSRSIEQKSASLKLLVESNFERFVKAKATIDNVYTEMRTQGNASDPTSATVLNKRTSHTRQTSRGTHARNASNPFDPTNPAAMDDRRKNALTKEAEFGVAGIKIPLTDLSTKVQDVWGPALRGRDREAELKSILSFVHQNHDIMQLPGDVKKSIAQHQFQTLVEDYTKARKALRDVKAIVDRAERKGETLTDAQVRKITVVAKVWHDVEELVETFRKESMRRLGNSTLLISSAISPQQQNLHDVALIKVLLQLGTRESPTLLWLTSWHEALSAKIAHVLERWKVDIEIRRRRIGNAPEPTLVMIKQCLMAANKTAVDSARHQLDLPQTIAFWQSLEQSLGDILQVQGGLLGDITSYWDSAKAWIDGKPQQTLANAVWASEEGKKHLHLSSEHTRDLHSRTIDLVNLIRDSIYSFFTDPPMEDISALVSPLPPPTPNDPSSAFPRDGHRLDLPPPSPRRGDAWEKYAFWPPHATSLSGATHLNNIVNLIALAANNITSITIITSNARAREQLKSMVNSVRERCVQAVCAAWNSDSEKCKILEDWSRNADRRDLTNMPARFMAFEEHVLTQMQKILYIPEATARVSSSELVGPPSSKLLQTVRSQFVTTLYKALSGTVENAEKLKRPKDVQEDEIESLMSVDGFENGRNGAVDAAASTHRNVCMLLTLSNLSHLRKEAIPHLISHFETLFSVKLAEESKTMRDVLGQIDSRLFQTYIKPSVDRLSSLVEAGVSPASWLPDVTRPKNAKPYVYDVLLYLVIIHTEVSTSATTLTTHVLSYLLEQVSLSILAAFKHRADYSLPALMQATLDVELIAQTLNTYTTERAGEIQGQIYLVLDERTEDAARTKLQSELPEMRATLKRLREGTKGQFGCFKRDRRARDKGEKRHAAPDH